MTNARKRKPALDSIIQAVDNLPPFPKVVSKVIPLLRNFAPVEEIESVIKYDQAITARVLAISRSPYYARRYKIRSLKDAIIVLGQRQLIEIILMSSAAHFLRGKAEGYDLREGELWEHSVAASILSQSIAETIGRKRALTIYTAGLLHDVGKVVLNQQVADYMDSIYMLIKEKGISFLEAEEEIIGVNHQVLGSLMARRWRFPKEVEVGIRYHHSPFDASVHQDIAAIVYAANRIVSSVGIGTSAIDFLQPGHDEVFARLKITQAMIDRFMVEILEAMEATRKFIGV